MNMLLFYSLILCNEYIFLTRSYKKKLKEYNKSFNVLKFDIFDGIKVEEYDEDCILKEDFDKLIVNDVFTCPGILKIFYKNELDNKIYESRFFFNNKILDNSRIFLVSLFMKLQKIILSTENERQLIIKRFMKTKSKPIDLCAICRNSAVEFIKKINYQPISKEYYVKYVIEKLVKFLIDNFSDKINKSAIENFLKLKFDEIYFMDNELLDKLERLNDILYDKFIFTDEEIRIFDIATNEKTFKFQVVNN